MEPIKLVLLLLLYILNALEVLFFLILLSTLRFSFTLHPHFLPMSYNHFTL